MNQSEEAIPFEAKLNKAKINLDPMYLHFLPLILKTLKKNKYFDKIIEDDSTQTPFDKEGNPENLYTKNIFSDSSNWMAMPTSRLFTIEYKTSPIVYFKYPTRNAEHFTKVRRVRDYQRIMNYVDKMISDRVAFTSTVPVIKSTFSLHKKRPHITYPSTTPMSTVEEHGTIKQSAFRKSDQRRLGTSTSTTTKRCCQCPKRMSRLLTKLIKSLENILPDIAGNEQHLSSCAEKKILKINKSSQKNEYPITKANNGMKTRKQPSDEIINKEKSIQATINSAEIPAEAFKNTHFDLLSTLNYDRTPSMISKISNSIKPSYSNVESTLSPTTMIAKPSIFYDQPANITTSYEPTEQFIEATSTDYYSLKDTTTPMSKVTSKSKNLLKTYRNFVLHKNDKKHSTKPLPTLSSTEYEDFFTTPDILKGFKWLTVQSIGQAKNKMAANNNNEKRFQKGETEFNSSKVQLSQKPFHFKEKEYDNTRYIWRKMGQLAHFLKNQIHNKNNWPNNITNVESMNKTQKVDSPHNQESIQSYLSENKLEQQHKNEDITLEEEIYNETYDSGDIIPEDNMKNLENLLNKINVTEIFNRTLKNENEKEKYYVHNMENSADPSYKNSRSMIPENRPSYLEMQRNDWKRHDDNNNNVDDYDNNIFL